MRHHALSDCISRAFGAAGIPVRKEPAGLVQKDGKRPDGCTLIPWRGGRPVAWDVTVCTAVAAASYVTAASQSAGAAAEQAAARKSLKYAALSIDYEFQPVAVEALGPMDEATIFLSLSWAVSGRRPTSATAKRTPENIQLSGAAVRALRDSRSLAIKDRK